MNFLRRFFTLSVIVGFAVSCAKEAPASHEEIKYDVDGPLVLQQDWKPVYVGRYDFADDGRVVALDRLSALGTGGAFYYHVFVRAGQIKNEEDLLTAFKEGTGIDDLNGGRGVINWYKALSSHDSAYSLHSVLAYGGVDSDYGYMDYDIKGDGIYDVYVVEMLLNGHISGRYGVSELDINGDPLISDLSFITGTN